MKHVKKNTIKYLLLYIIIEANFSIPYRYANFSITRIRMQLQCLKQILHDIALSHFHF